MKRFTLSCLVLLVAVFLCVSFAIAGEVDVLVNKLVEKGVLTQGEAQQMLTEAKEESRKEIAQGKNETLPKWLQTTKFSGDMRVRYQGEDHQTDETSVKHHRDRARFRLRYGFDMKPNDLMHVGFRMATGENKQSSSSPYGVQGPEQTSTNQSFTNTFNNKWIWVDQAYVDYTPFGNKDIAILKDMKLVGGKFPNPFYTTDMVWDPDTNPEGGYVQFNPQFGTVKPFLTFAYLPMGESETDSNDPAIAAIQGGLSSTIMNRPYKIASAYYAFENIKGMTATTYTGQFSPKITNTLDGSLLKYGFNVLEFTGDFSPMDLNLLGNTMPLTILGNYAKNLAKGDIKNDTAWLAGLKLGKAKEKGTWEVFWNYRQIGQDAVYSWINDSDFHLGGTASKGHKFGLTYAVMPNSTVSATYYMTEPFRPDVIPSLDKRKINIIQLDWVTKF
jgi:hypothetical protein